MNSATVTTKGISALNKIVGHCKGHPDVRHVKCGGQLSVGGFGTVGMPMGLGFASRGGRVGFGIDVATFKTYSGFCLKCQAEGIFIRDDQKPRMSVKRIKGVK